LSDGIKGLAVPLTKKEKKKKKAMNKESSLSHVFEKCSALSIILLM